jgi:hypothetical protein
MFGADMIATLLVLTPALAAELWWLAEASCADAFSSFGEGPGAAAGDCDPQGGPPERRVEGGAGA